MSRPTRHVYRWLLAAVAIGLAAASVFWQAGEVERRPEPGLLHTRIKSGNLSVDYSVQQALQDYDRLSLRAINVPVAVRVRDLQASDVQLDPDSVDKARLMIRELKTRGAAILLEPYPWIAEGTLVETEWHPADVERFFASWWNEALLKLIEQLAVPEAVDVLVVASNLRHLEPYEERWLELIARVKERYDGLVTYKTNWWYTAAGDEASQRVYEEKLRNRIFSAVDFISVAAYFELTDQADPDVGQLIDALRATNVYGRRQNVVAELERLHETWDKPVYFGELGFPKRKYAAMQPWNPAPSELDDEQVQARAFEAYRQVFTQEWFLGFSVFAIGEAGADKSYYPSPQSEEVIRRWLE